MGRTLEIEATEVFEKNYAAYENPNINLIGNQGGSRSSKTYSVVQLLILIGITKPNLTISIVRKTMPSLMATVYEDWLEIMHQWGLYKDKFHKKQRGYYKHPNGTRFEFFSLDDSQKVRGRKRDILYLNEATEIDMESFIQLEMRTKGKIFIDFNPSEIEHWAYERLEQEDATLIKSTYLDNPFLSDLQIKRIKDLIKADPDYYKIYALGERVLPKSLVYNHFVKYDNLPPTDEIIDVAYGLDIGYQHDTAFVECTFATENRLYFREVFVENKLTSEDIGTMIANSDYDRTKEIYIDSARPDMIEALRRKGIRAKLANKDVKRGIDFIKTHQCLYHINSINLERELKLYSYKVKRDGTITDEIDKQNDDVLDSARYSAYTHGRTLNATSAPFIIFD